MSYDAVQRRIAMNSGTSDFDMVRVKLEVLPFAYGEHGFEPKGANMNLTSTWRMVPECQQ